VHIAQFLGRVALPLSDPCEVQGLPPSWCRQDHWPDEAGHLPNSPRMRRTLPACLPDRQRIGLSDWVMPGGMTLICFGPTRAAMSARARALQPRSGVDDRQSRQAGQWPVPLARPACQRSFPRPACPALHPHAQPRAGRCRYHGYSGHHAARQAVCQRAGIPCSRAPGRTAPRRTDAGCTSD